MLTAQPTWKRFWVPRGEPLLLADRGFFPDPDLGHSRGFNAAAAPFEELASVPCLVLLGEPGLGKSTALRAHRDALGRGSGQAGKQMLWRDLNVFTTDLHLVQSVFADPLIRTWAEGEGALHLFLDSFDECLLRVETLAALIDEELAKCPAERLRLRLACRTAVWPAHLEERLRQLWGPDNVGVYELAPLRRSDVAETATLAGVDPSAFLAEIDRREAAPLAGRPITLRFLLASYKGTGTFPRTQAELYALGCERLCEEASPTRKAAGRRGNLSPPQRRAVAARIAALSVFCARPGIWTDIDPGDDTDELLRTGDLVGGTEVIDDHPFEVTEAGVREVLDTGLFSAWGPQQLGFAHQTYAEFLAAHYLHRRRMSLGQLKDLLTHAGDRQGRIVPQLQEAAAWLAGMVPEVFDLTARQDPKVLLGSDAATMSAAGRQQLVSTLLRLYDAGELSDAIADRPAKYAKLAHPQLAAQLTPYIQDRSKNIVVRRVAIDMAEACGIQPLQGLLADIALDRTEDQHVRAQAASAVAKVGDEPGKRRLRPLLVGGAGEDPDDELKAAALRALWPALVAAEEVFTSLTPPKRASYFGMYSLFLAETLVERLPARALPVALHWVARQPAPEEVSPTWDRVLEQILTRAWDHEEEPGVLEAHAQAALAKAATYLPIPGLRYDKEGEGLLRRRRLAAAVAGILIARGGDAQILVFTQTPLIVPGDLPWLLECLRRASPPHQPFWAKAIHALYRSGHHGQTDRIVEAAGTCPALAEEFAPLLEPVPLNSPAADELRKSYQGHQEWLRRLDAAPQPVQPPPPERVAILLARAEAGNLDAWWRLNRELTLTPTSTHYGDELEADLTALPGWEGADQQTQARIVEAAKGTLYQRQPRVQDWLGTNAFHRADFAGYRALLLLAREQPTYLESLPAEVWRKWAPVVVAYPTVLGTPGEALHQAMVSLAYLHAPDEVIATLLALIDWENREGNSLLIHRKVALCWDAGVASALVAKVRDPGLKPSCMGHLLASLLDRECREAKQFAESLLPVPVSTEGVARERAAAAAAALIGHAQDCGWAAVWPAVQQDPAFGRDVFLKVADRYDPPAATPLGRALTEAQLADLYLWLVGQFPPTEDPAEAGAHFMGPRESAADLRDGILQQLLHRGTPAACVEVGRVVEALPQLTWLKWASITAREVTLRRTWAPLRPGELLRLARERDTRLVESGEQLLEVLIESLRRLQQELQGENPAAPDLWNEVRDGVHRPKDEQALSNYVVRHLRRDLGQQGIILNREVEIRRGEGDADGERVDIHADAVSPGSRPGGLSRVTVVIELKGGWNGGVKKDMEQQLRERYLKDSRCHHGLYVVGWFHCPQWDKTDPRYQRSPKLTVQQAQTLFDGQSTALSKGELLIKAVVLNAALR